MKVSNMLLHSYQEIVVICLAVFAVLLFGSCSSPQIVGQPIIEKSKALDAAKGKRILIIVSARASYGKLSEKTGYWLSEITEFYHVMSQHGFQIDIASPGGRPGVMDPESRDMDIALNRSFWQNPKLRAQLERPLSVKRLDSINYAVIYFAGGHGTMWDFTKATAIADLAAAIYERGGIVAAVCHGPSGLINIQLANGEYLIKGKQVTGFANFEEKLIGKIKKLPYLLEDKLKERGAIYSKAVMPFGTYAVTDGRLVTGQNPLSAIAVAEQVITILETR